MSADYSGRVICRRASKLAVPWTKATLRWLRSNVGGGTEECIFGNDEFNLVLWYVFRNVGRKDIASRQSLCYVCLETRLWIDNWTRLLERNLEQPWYVRDKELTFRTENESGKMVDAGRLDLLNKEVERSEIGRFEIFVTSDAKRSCVRLANTDM